MRVAALNDVHGNLPALEAVLAEVERAAPDLVVFGGDVFAGPFPHETLALVRSVQPARYVVGNADVLLPDLPDEARWAHEQLTDDDREFVAAWEPTVTVEIDGMGPTLFCHATPRSREEIFTVRTPDERLAEILAGVEERVVVCGHTHMQFDRTVAGIRVVNAGSVGMPYAERPGAYCALLGPDVELRRTDYDLEAAAARIRASGWPNAESFAAENVLSVPSEQEALAVFEPRVG